MALKQNYKDEVVSGERTFNIVDENGRILYPNIHFEQTYVPDVIGDNLGAGDINGITKEVNRLSDRFHVGKMDPPPDSLGQDGDFYYVIE